MVREEKVTKGKVLVELAHYGAKAKAFRESIDLIVRKMDLITDKDSKEYSELSEVANLIWAMHDAAEKTEANEKLDEILGIGKASSVMSANGTDNA